VGLHAVELVGVEPIAHRDGQTDVEALARLHAERAFRRVGLCSLFWHAGGEEVIAQVEGLHALDQRRDEMHAGIKCAGEGSANLADAHAAHSAGDDDDAGCDEQRQAGDQYQRDRTAPVEFVRLDCFAGRA
jgi:hypothetical protein